MGLGNKLSGLARSASGVAVSCRNSAARGKCSCFSASDDGAATNLCDRWTVDPSFERSPPRCSIRQHVSDNVLLEDRAAVEAMRRTAASRHGWHTRLLFRRHGMSLVLSLCCARPSSFPLVQVRRFHGYALACWVHPSIRFIPLELNASGAESRQQTHSDEHSALAFLATCSLEPPRLLRRRLDHGSETVVAPSSRPATSSRETRSGNWRIWRGARRTHPSLPLDASNAVEQQRSCHTNGSSTGKEVEGISTEALAEVAATAGGLAFLEREAVPPLTQSSHQKVMHTFVTYCERVGSPLRFFEGHLASATGQWPLCCT